MTRHCVSNAAVALTFFFAAGDAYAGAFQLREGSATALGAALAGRTANDADVSLAIQNPASLRGVAEFEASAGLSFLYAQGDANTSASLPGFVSSDTPNESAFVPSFTLGYRVSPTVVLGLAVDAPFGLATEYEANFVGAFDGVRSELTTITVTPMASWDVTPALTIGGGVMLQYADAELQSSNGASVQNISGDGFDVGFTLGVIAEPISGTRLGLSAQTGFSHKLEGEFSGNFTVPGPSGPFTGYAGAPGEAAFDLPPIVSAGVIQSITPTFRVMGEVEWTGWSAFDDITISSPGLPDIVDPQRYDDSFMFSVGAEYDVNDALTVRGGWAYDQTPTNDRFRTTRTPDGDKMWFAAGASYQISESIGVDLAYIYLLVDDTTVTLRNGPPGVAGSRVDYSNADVHLFSANLRYAF
ncbi:OmpP1/FadL family transporter [Rubrimonas cliftonensis]|uniref:Long-chain fatty acid transport protein n=1 Tax=Rubrimonas cliftonensis TaxID=89524 RepID=A0A1H3YKD8_9RHOB|nr:outer membrane protein transport protein [Rubrimonas cliftonensis]SEA11412.1 long-chain fatty acid transport protein [Rubrimonas cliftonensis]